MAVHSALVVTLLILCSINQGDAVECYSCSGHTDCNDDFIVPSERVKTKNSSGNPQYGSNQPDECKYCIKVKNIKSGRHTVSRSCYSKNEVYSINNMGCFSCDPDDASDPCTEATNTITCYCDEDNCNHGNRAPASWILPLVAVVCKKIFF